MGRAAEGFEVGAAAERHTQVVSDGADVGAGADASPKTDANIGQKVEFEFVNRHGNRSKLDLMLAAGESVGGDAADFLCRKWRGNLLDRAKEAGSGFPCPSFVNFLGEFGGGLSLFL